MLAALNQALLESAQCDQVTDQVALLLQVLQPGIALKANELMQRLVLSHRPTFSKNYLKPALAAGFIEITDPVSPRSPVERYQRALGNSELPGKA